MENVIKQMLQPLKGIPFNFVIQNLSDCKILPFNEQDPNDKELLKDLKNVAIFAGNEINKNGIYRKRANEVGNDIETFVKDALNYYGLSANKPKTISGKKKSTGYPDLEFFDKAGRLNYLECKTFNIKNINSTQRSFYLSPSIDFKIKKDAHHFAISYEVYVFKSGFNNCYKVKSWKLLDLELLVVDVKYEFNADNKRLYNKELVLLEGDMENI